MRGTTRTTCLTISQPRSQGNRRNSGAQLPLHRPSHRGLELHGLHRARILAPESRQRRGQPQARHRKSSRFDASPKALLPLRHPIAVSGAIIGSVAGRTMPQHLSAAGPGRGMRAATRKRRLRILARPAYRTNPASTAHRMSGSYSRSTRRVVRPHRAFWASRRFPRRDLRRPKSASAARQNIRGTDQPA